MRGHSKRGLENITTGIRGSVVHQYFDLVGVMLIALDMDGRVALVNKKGCEILRGEENDILGEEWLSRFVPRSARDEVKAVFDRLMSGEVGSFEYFENEVVTLEGDVRVISWHNAVMRDRDGTTTFILSSGEDVTEQRKVQEALERSEANLRVLMENMPEAVVVHRDGKLVYVNRALWENLGYDGPGDLVGRPVLEIVHHEDREKVLERVGRMLQANEPSPLEEIRYLHRDGCALSVELSARQIAFDGESSIMAIARDITERKELQARIMRMDRMLAVGTLASGVGHEINNPLTYVTENIKYVLRKLDKMAPEELDEEVREALEQARYGTGRIALVIRDLQTFARADEETLAVIPVERIVESAVSMAWNEIKHRARLHKEFAPGLRVLANEARLGQVFLNLLMNAAHAIPEGKAEKNEIRVRTFEREGMIVIEVQDTGSGIPVQDRDRVFDPFFTTKPMGQGTGLGLSICREIVDAHEGELYLQSETGKGSTFTVEIPPARPAREKGATQRLPPRAERKRGRILVVDDESMICSMMSRALGKDHDVVTVTDAREARAMFWKGERFDVVFCDLMMPEMTGMDLYAELVKISQADASRMVFLTGGAFTPRAREFLSSVPNEWMKKPFDVVKVRLLVQEMLETSR